MFGHFMKRGHKPHVKRWDWGKPDDKELQMYYYP